MCWGQHWCTSFTCSTVMLKETDSFELDHGNTNFMLIICANFVSSILMLPKTSQVGFPHELFLSQISCCCWWRCWCWWNLCWRSGVPPMLFRMPPTPAVLLVVPTSYSSRVTGCTHRLLQRPIWLYLPSTPPAYMAVLTAYSSSVYGCTHRLLRQRRLLYSPPTPAAYMALLTCTYRLL